MSNDQDVRYEMDLTPQEAMAGTLKLLARGGKKLEVKIPPGTLDGYTVKLTNALQVTDGRPGDILITVRVVQAPGRSGVIEINDDSFGREVLESNMPVVVDFWAQWCGPCRMIGPIMEKLSVQYAGKIKFCKINVDENQRSASQYQAMSIPLLVFFKSGGEVGRSVGALPEPALRSKIEQALG
jgi:thioredoxin 1